MNFFSLVFFPFLFSFRISLFSVFLFQKGTSKNASRSYDDLVVHDHKLNNYTGNRNSNGQDRMALLAPHHTTPYHTVPHHTTFISQWKKKQNQNPRNILIEHDRPARERERERDIYTQRNEEGGEARRSEARRLVMDFNAYVCELEITIRYSLPRVLFFVFVGFN